MIWVIGPLGIEQDRGEWMLQVSRLSAELDQAKQSFEAHRARVAPKEELIVFTLISTCCTVGAP